jgi:uncharacterized membrane protein
VSGEVSQGPAVSNQPATTSHQQPAPNSRPPQRRLLPVDALRGLIIIVMALDHANHFVAQKHSSGEYWGGPFPVYDDPLAFLTRFVTHIAAPGFFFLMGVGMFLFASARDREGWGKWAVLRHFWIRGALLIGLQLLVVNRAWELSPGGWGTDVYIGVLFALGGAMILGSLFLWLRPAYLLALAALLFLGSELLHPDPAAWGQVSNELINLLLLRPGGDASLWSNYPVLPWLELALFGIFFGRWLREDAPNAYRRGLRLGLAFLLAFAVLRLLDDFGNVRPRAGDGWIDFLNVVKYPPSMTFTLLTTGINLIALAAFARLGEWRPALLRPLAVFGRAPLFFYLLHLFLYLLLGVLFTPGGSSIPFMFPFWLLGLLILYPLCLLYGNFKSRRPATSLWRML